jgi:hypothetical protein
LPLALCLTHPGLSAEYKSTHAKKATKKKGADDKKEKKEGEEDVRNSLFWPMLSLLDKRSYAIWLITDSTFFWYHIG